LGILNLEVMNIDLLAKWLWKLFNEKDELQMLLTNKYLKKSTLSQVTPKKWGFPHLARPDGSERYFFSSFKFQVGNGRKTCF
jgi:hypothetical protein